MTTIRFRKPVTRTLHPHNWVRPAGSYDFRVTQRFDDLDSYWSKDPAKAAQKHRATDLGNTLCGDILVAMAPGRVEAHLRDNATQFGAPTDALGVSINHGHGIVIAYWHVQAVLLPVGSAVVAGTPVARLGKTGLGNVCHVHVTGRKNGVLFDVEPLMFGGSLTIEEDDMKLSGTFIGHVFNSKTELAVDSHFRAGVLAGDDASIAVLPKGESFIPVIRVKGRSVGTAPDRAEWYGGWKTSSGNGSLDGPTFGYVHSSVLTRTLDSKGVDLDPIHTIPKPADCTAEVAAATASATSKERARWTAWLAGRPQ